MLFLPYVPVHFSYEMWRMVREWQGEVYKQDKTMDENVSKKQVYTRLKRRK